MISCDLMMWKLFIFSHGCVYLVNHSLTFLVLFPHPCNLFTTFLDACPVKRKTVVKESNPEIDRSKEKSFIQLRRPKLLIVSGCPAKEKQWLKNRRGIFHSASIDPKLSGYPPKQKQ
jgi:hypothetical protein